MKKHYYLLALIVLAGCARPGQSQVKYYQLKDGLEGKGYKHFTTLDSIYQECYYYYYYTGASGDLKRTCDILLQRATDSSSKKYEAWAHILLNKYYGLAGQMDLALNELNKAHEIYREKSWKFWEKEIKEGLVIDYKESGRTYKEMECYKEAKEQLHLAEEEFKQLGTNKLSNDLEWDKNRICYNMAEVYLQLSLDTIQNKDSARIYMDRAETYANLAFDVANKSESNFRDPYGKAMAMIVQAKVAFYKYANNPDSSYGIFRSCIDFCKADSMRYPLAMAYLGYSSILKERGRLAEAEANADSGLVMAIRTNYYKGIAGLYGVLRNVYYDSVTKLHGTDSMKAMDKCRYYAYLRDSFVTSSGYTKSVALALNTLVAKDVNDENYREEAEKDNYTTRVQVIAFIMFIIVGGILGFVIDKSVQPQRADLNRFFVFVVIALFELLGFFIHFLFHLFEKWINYHAEPVILLIILIAAAIKFDTLLEIIKEWGNKTIIKKRKRKPTQAQ